MIEIVGDLVVTLPALRDVVPGTSIVICGPAKVVSHESDSIWKWSSDSIWKWSKKKFVHLVRGRSGWKRVEERVESEIRAAPSGWWKWAEFCVAHRAKAAARARRGGQR